MNIKMLMWLYPQDSTPKQVENRIDYACDNPNADFVVCSIHKVKGQESEDCYFIGYGEFFDDIDNWDAATLREERRLMYVALTRSKMNLNLVTLSPYREEGIETVIKDDDVMISFEDLLKKVADPKPITIDDLLD